MPDQSPVPWPGHTPEVEARAVEAAFLSKHKERPGQFDDPRNARLIEGYREVVNAVSPVIAEAGWRAGIEDARAKLREQEVHRAPEEPPLCHDDQVWNQAIAAALDALMEGPGGEQERDTMTLHAGEGESRLAPPGATTDEGGKD